MHGYQHTGFKPPYFPKQGYIILENGGGGDVSQLHLGGNYGSGNENREKGKENGKGRKKQGTLNLKG
jgi:hypothetical protein